MRDTPFLSRRQNGNAEGAWRGPREPDDGDRNTGGWWALERPAGGNTEPAGAVDASKSKKDLYREAKDAGIEGRSSMNKKQLVEALRRHRETGSSREPTPRRAPRPPPRTTPPRPSGARARETERCAIAYRASDSHGEFQVVVTEADGSRTSAARSPGFPVPAGEIRRAGAARAAHELLVKRLMVSGWWPAESGDAWPEIQFVRVRPAGEAGGRSLVTVVREAGRAHFVVEEVDGYGNAMPLVASDPFRAPRLLPVRPSRHAKAAFNGVLERLGPEGWTFGGHVGDEWYSISLARGRGTAGARSRRTVFG